MGRPVRIRIRMVLQAVVQGGGHPHCVKAPYAVIAAIEAVMTGSHARCERRLG